MIDYLDIEGGKIIMLYGKLTARIAELSGVSEEVVREVLYAFPRALMEDVESGKTRTPMGVFTLVRRPEKRVRTPDGKWSKAPSLILARLRPGNRMRKRIPKSLP